MNKMRWMIAVFLTIALMAGCVPVQTTTPQVKYVVVTATPDEAAAPADPTAAPATAVPAADAMLKLKGLDAEKTLSLDELKAMPVTEGWSGTKSSTGKISPPSYFKGVSLKDLAESLGAFDESLAVTVVAKDGYAMTMSYDQVINGTFTTFDPATGDEVTRDEALAAIVAYERDGEPIPEESDGTLRLQIVSENKDQVTDGHWSVKWVREVIIKTAASDWTLHLEGALVEDMDRGTFESGSAPNCHLAEWADADGNVWAGIPLYLLLGRVDDENKHETGAFNAELAEAGYAVDVVAADGYKVSFNSKDLARNTTVILAYLMNGEPLEEKHFPLRLVGSSLDKGQMVGAVAQIVLHMDEVVPAEESEPTTEPEEPAGGDAPEMAAGTLHIWGKVGVPSAFTEAEFAQQTSVTREIEHPKKGPQEYTGVPLLELLALTEPDAGAASVVFTASDGYTAEVAWADVAACEDCLVTFDGEIFSTVMPGQETSAWVKDVQLIEVK